MRLAGGQARTEQNGTNRIAQFKIKKEKKTKQKRKEEWSSEEKNI